MFVLHHCDLLLWCSCNVGMQIYCFWYSKTCSHSDFLSSIVSFKKSSYIKMPIFFSFFALYKIHCLSLNLSSLQTTVHDWSRFWSALVLQGPIMWHLSISMSLFIPNLSTMIFQIFFTCFPCLIRFFLYTIYSEVISLRSVL